MRHSLEIRLAAVPSKHLRRKLQYSLQSTKARRGVAARCVLTSLFQKEWGRFHMTRVPIRFWQFGEGGSKSRSTPSSSKSRTKRLIASRSNLCQFVYVSPPTEMRIFTPGLRILSAARDAFRTLPE